MQRYLENAQIINELLDAEDKPNVSNSLNQALYLLHQLPKDDIQIKMPQN